jgi:putative ABC transport system permease protein
VTYSCWKRLGSDPLIVGKLVGSFSIIGVTPKEFTGSLFGINGDLLVPALAPMTFENIEDLSLLPDRIVAGCVTVLSALGLLLAVVGLFGAISYSVSERKREFGIRVALGAQPGQLLKMIFRQTLSIAGAGTMMGVASGVAVTIVVRSQFYGIGAVEWSVLVPVGAAMLAVSLAIAYVSARPWIKVDPREAVRHP